MVKLKNPEHWIIIYKIDAKLPNGKWITIIWDLLIFKRKMQFFCFYLIGFFDFTSYEKKNGKHMFLAFRGAVSISR